MTTPGSGDQHSPAYAPPTHVLDLAAQADARGAPTQAVSAPHPPGKATAVPACVTATCRIPLWISVFFDGTGNNRDADEPTHRDSNVARLFRSHGDDISSDAKFAIYVPGVGTYFRDIGDPGNTDKGMAFAKYGEARLAWALKQVDLVVARYPQNRLKEINIALFGFSRGAAAARAFALRLANQRTGKGNTAGSWYWAKTKVPFRLRFMGVFDTVASVGPPATAGTRSSLFIAKNWRQLDGALHARSTSTIVTARTIRDDPVSVRGLAFGAPGADPTPGMLDGHRAWGDGLHVPVLVEDCLHLVAAHEQRNSFPLDSVRNGNVYPANCREMVLPGVHSDLGGGYAPGFQGRIKSRNEALSNIALRIMHKEALKKGVPLEEIGKFSFQDLDQRFSVSPDLLSHWQHYMSVVGNSRRPLGQAFLAHMRLYFAWRFQRINSQTMPDEASIRRQEQTHAAEQARMKRELDRLQSEKEHAVRNLRQSKLASEEATRSAMHSDPTKWKESLDKSKAQADGAERKWREAEHRYNAYQARWAGIPTPSLDNMGVYDRQLVRDAELIRGAVKAGRQPLRPHYAALLAAYEAEFLQGAGLRDQKIIDFFDRYVHDSLAGFAKDATLPSDPRAIYMGGDNEIPYANNLEAEPDTQMARVDSPVPALG